MLNTSLLTKPTTQDQYYPAELNGKSGLVPSNFVENLKEHSRSKETDSLAREDSTEATIATMLAQAAENVSQRDPLKKNVPSSSELDVRNTMSVRYVKYVLLAYQIDLIALLIVL